MEAALWGFGPSFVDRKAWADEAFTLPVMSQQRYRSVPSPGLGPAMSARRQVAEIIRRGC
jgi:hypothetical protein